MPGLIQQELAQILRARVELAIRIADGQMADANLAELAKLSEEYNVKLIETAYHGAAGALLSPVKIRRMLYFTWKKTPIIPCP